MLVQRIIKGPCLLRSGVGKKESKGSISLSSDFCHLRLLTRDLSFIVRKGRYGLSGVMLTTSIIRQTSVTTGYWFPY